MAIRRPGVCVAVSDLEKTTLFYQSLFDQPVERSTDKFVAFDVNGAQFSLLHESGYAFLYPTFREGYTALIEEMG